MHDNHHWKASVLSSSIIRALHQYFTCSDRAATGTVLSLVTSKALMASLWRTMWIRLFSWPLTVLTERTQTAGQVDRCECECVFDYDVRQWKLRRGLCLLSWSTHCTTAACATFHRLHTHTQTVPFILQTVP